MNHFAVLKVPLEFWRKILRDKSSGGYWFATIAFFVPAIICFLVNSLTLTFQRESYGFLVAVFSIFAAFLFASQISAFTIFQGILNSRAIALSNEIVDLAEDKVAKGIAIEEDRIAEESIRKGFSLINLAISYSVALSVVILMTLIVLYLGCLVGIIFSLVLTFLMSHFFLVLIFTIGQSHEVFSLGYGDK